MHCLLNRNQSDKKRTFSRLDKAMKLSQMTDYPTLSYPSISKIPTLSYTWRSKKVPISGGASLWLAILGRTPPPPRREMGKTDLMRLPMAFPFFCSFYRMPLTCYPSYINYQMPLCCSQSLLSWHKYKHSSVRWGLYHCYSIPACKKKPRYISRVFATIISSIFFRDHQRPWLRFRWIIFCRCSNIRTDREGEGLSLTHIPTIMKAVLNITRTFEVNRTP